jgi:hypothetical protein
MVKDPVMDYKKKKNFELGQRKYDAGKNKVIEKIVSRIKDPGSGSRLNSRVRWIIPIFRLDRKCHGSVTCG